MATNVLCNTDVGKKLIATVKDSSGTIVNVTHATVKYVFLRADGTVLVRPATVLVGASGTCTYTLQADDIQAGHLGIQLRIILGGADVCSKQHVTTVQNRYEAVA